MKKRLYIYACVAFTLSACSSDNPIIEEQNPQTSEVMNVLEDDDIDIPEDVVIKESDVPIEFNLGIGELEGTRGSLSTTDFTQTDIGVFCLSRKAINGNTIGVKWAPTDNPVTNLARMWLKNVKARVENYSGGNGQLVWADGKEHFILQTTVIINLPMVLLFITHIPIL